MQVTAYQTKTVNLDAHWQFTAEVQLVSIGGQEPYFSATGNEESRRVRNDGTRNMRAAGMLHDEILRHFPRFAPVVRVHLSDRHGVPMHHFDNGRYWLGLTEWQPLNIGAITQHFRCTEEEAIDLADKTRLAKIDGLNVDGVVHYFIERMRPRWQAEADEAMEVLA